MSLSDPLLKSVKYLVQEFHSVGEPVTDKSVYLEQFCNAVEQCFLKGMKKGQWDITKESNRSSQRRRFWQILRSFETDGPMPFSVTTAINAALADIRLRSSDGRARYLIRHCLAHKSLHVLLEFLVTKRVRLKEWYYENQSSGKQAMQSMVEFGGGSTILIHEELSEQLRSLLLTCSTSLTFDLHLQNSYFLDESWKLPKITTLELVPTRELGIEIIYINGYAIITRLKAGSVANDALHLGVGDLLVEMNGEMLFPATLGGDHDAISVWRHCRKHSLPCKLTVVKPRSPITGGIFGPLRATLTKYHGWMDTYCEMRKKKLDIESERAERKDGIPFLSSSKSTEKTTVLDPEVAEDGVGGKFIVRYVGEVSTGEEGGINQIEGVIRRALQKRLAKTTFNATLTLTQIAVDTQISGSPLFLHKYADISSCGKIISDELHFCYIAGDTFCTISKQFKGYVFEAQTLAQAKSILNGIHLGFKRTTWFM